MMFNRDTGTLSATTILGAGAIAVALPLATMNVATQAAPMKEVNDQTVADSVTDELSYDFGVIGETIDVDTDDGVVTLTGTVTSLLAKDRAAAIAQTVKGVKSVVNRVTVNPRLQKSSAMLRTDVNLALARNPATDSYEIDISPNDSGVVTMDGQVGSWQEKALAEKVVAGVTGVTAIDNNLDVVYDAETRSDEAIQSEIEDRFYYDVLIDGEAISVDVDNDVVTLSGSVASAAEKERAREFAHVAGVTMVETGNLSIDETLDETGRRAPSTVDVSDEDLASAVQNAISYDPRVERTNVTVSSDDGTVTLRGKVDSVIASRAAEMDARNTIGADKVENRLSVRPGEGPLDNELKENIIDAVEANAYLERHDLSFFVNGGVVDIYGTVDNYFEKEKVDTVVASVVGVRSINNSTLVRNTYDALVEEPYVTDYNVGWYDWYDYRPRMNRYTDAELQAEVRDELWWSPFVDSDDVEINVDRGTVTLSGAVESQAARQAATENAWEGGASMVVNLLEIADTDAS